MSKRMIKSLWMALCLYLLPAAITAQSGHLNILSTTPEASVGGTTRHLSQVDSIALLRDSIFGPSYRAHETHTSQLPSLSAAQLFLPLTFYDDRVLAAFTIGSGEGKKEQVIVDSTLMNIYIRRPDLVTTTSTRLRSDRSYLDIIDAPIHTETDLENNSASKPVEPDVVPVQLVLHKPNFWHYSGDYSLRFMQSYVSNNWYKGDESNFSALASVIMEANYNNKQKLKWENKLEMRFGFQSSRSDSLHQYKSTEDLLRLTSKIGLQASKRWYYTLQLLAYTQFTHSYKSNDPTLYSDFLAPLNVNLSLGMDYSVDWMQHRLRGNIHLAPLAYNMKYTRIRSLSSRLGIEDGRRVLNDFGSEFTIDLTWQLMEDFSWRTRLYAYTTYERAELEWENTFVLRFNRFISAQVFLYPRFDDGVARDSHHGYLQFKEYASIGFNFNF